MILFSLSKRIHYSDKMKIQIREIIEYQEIINYKKQLKKDLRPLKTTRNKEYLTEAPYLILVFKQTHGIKAERRITYYYNEISCAASAGILLCALQSAGLSSAMTRPLNCGAALRNLLNRPPNEKLLFLVPVGYPAESCEVPDLQRKPVEEIMEIC